MYNFPIHRSILHDTTVFPEPEAFKPEKWFKKDTDANGNVNGQSMKPDSRIQMLCLGSVDGRSFIEAFNRTSC